MVRAINAGPLIRVRCQCLRRWRLASGILTVLAFLLLDASSVRTDGTQGQWRTLPYLMPINPVHLALMNNGRVLVVAGSGYLSTNTDYETAVWDPATGAMTLQPVGWDMFCNGMVVLSDGRVFINGGNLYYNPFRGELRSAIYDPAAGSMTNIENMAHGRWYPTVTVLRDGRVMSFSGLTETGGTNTAVEIYTAGSGWSQEYQADWTPPLYPWLHLIPDGRVFYSGSGSESRMFNPATNTWSGVIANTNYGGTRRNGSSVLLPLSPADGYKPRVMIMGGGNPATSTTEIIDLSASSPAWQWGPWMFQGRIEMNATILPSGKVLALGGSANDEDASTATLNADLYDPTTNTFEPAGANVYPRLYHSGSLLLPDATVMLVGGNPQQGSYEQHIEIYSPGYLFNSDGSTAVRPTIDSVTPGTVNYGAGFQVQTPNAADIRSVVLVRPGAPTHAFDMDQRLVTLSYSAGAGVLNLTAPPNGNIAPPGFYMLFILNSAGVPSVAKFVRLSTGPVNQPPTATIISPATNVTINAGQSVSFAGTGSDPDGTIAAYAWTFTGGNPSSSSVASPGNVTYSTTGTYTASLTVTDNGGRASSPATRSITVLSGNQAPTATITSPATNVTVNAGQAVSFAGSGSDPDGTIAAYAWTFPGGSPASSPVASPGNITYSTPGTYTASLTVTDNGGLASSPATRTVTVPDFSLSAAPASQAVLPGAGTTYTITVNPGSGFTGTVGFSVSGLPAGATASFSPPNVVTSGSTTLSVSTTNATPPGSYSLLVTGNTGVVTHTVGVTLVVSADFSIAASPSSTTVKVGASAGYAVTITGSSGFSGTVNLTVSGLPKFATGTFTPSSVIGSGSSTLSVTTSRKVAQGTYQLTVTGTSSAFTHAINVTLSITR